MILPSISRRQKTIIKIEHDGYTFVRGKCSISSTYWKCDQFKIGGRAKLIVSNFIGSYRVSNDIHGHPPPALPSVGCL